MLPEMRTYAAWCRGKTPSHIKFPLAVTTTRELRCSPRVSKSRSQRKVKAMRIHEAVQYLSQRNLNPLTVIECQAPSCGNSVQLARAVAFPARLGEEADRLSMAFFCSEACYLEAIPACSCPKA